jgi:hypothetical protein
MFVPRRNLERKIKREIPQMSIILNSKQQCFAVTMLALALGSATYFASGAAEKPPRATDNPDYNIFFVILDDVGADQLNISNPAGTALPSTPTINAIAAQGVNFSNSAGRCRSARPVACASSPVVTRVTHEC